MTRVLLEVEFTARGQLSGWSRNRAIELITSTFEQPAERSALVSGLGSIIQLRVVARLHADGTWSYKLKEKE